MRPLRLDEDVAVIHPWYQMDYAHYWNMQDMTLEATRDFYADDKVWTAVYAKACPELQDAMDLAYITGQRPADELMKEPQAQVAARRRDLTPHQISEVRLLGSVLMNKQRAHALGVSEATVKAHMTAILRKLGASNRTQAVLMAGRLAVDPQPADAELDQGL